MNDFWAIALGATLATVSGVITTLVSTYISKRNEKHKEKKEAYKRILDFCNQLRVNYNDAFKEISLNELSSLFTLIDLYLSKDLKKLLTSYICELKELSKNENNGESVCFTEAENIQDKLIKEIKKELNL